MQAAPIPANEAARLQALRELLILDTPPRSAPHLPLRGRGVRGGAGAGQPGGR
ncbi:MAG: hypothetical protein U1E77_03100 [Inhella sp.]